MSYLHQNVVKEVLVILANEMEFVEYIFGNFWHFIMFIVVLAVIFDGVADIVKAFHKPKNSENNDND